MVPTPTIAGKAMATCNWLFRQGAFASLLPILALIAITPVSPAAPVPKQSAAEAEKIRKKLFGCWVEIEIIQAGVRNPETHAWLAWHLTEKYTETVTLGGQTEMDRFPNALRINTATTPWQLDHVNDSMGPRGRKRYVCHGIFRFEGEHLVWVNEGPGILLDPDMEPSANYKYRPKDFTSTAENGQKRIVLKKSENRWFRE